MSLESLVLSDFKKNELAGIPCYFEKFEEVRLRWAFEAKHLLFHVEAGVAETEEQLTQPKLLKLTRERLKQHAKVLTEHFEMLKSLIAPLGGAKISTQDYFNFVQNRGFRRSELVEHYNNLHRDWSWGIDEIEKTLEILKKNKKGKGGNLLVVAAGACRLAYEIHKEFEPSLTVATDINPLLFLAAKKLLAGLSLDLFEISGLKRSSANNAEKRTLQGKKAGDNFHLVLTDANQPAFKPGSFDTIVTPWVIDVVPRNIETFFAQINTLLKPGGTWLNIGPLMYPTSFLRLFTAEETIALAEKAGFEVQNATNSFLPFMQSPLDTTKREEEVLSFRAVKKKEAEVEITADTTATWLESTTETVPYQGDMKDMALAHFMAGESLAMLDGKKSIEQMAELLSKRFNVPNDVAVHFIKRTLRNFLNFIQSNPMKPNR